MYVLKGGLRVRPCERGKNATQAITRMTTTWDVARESVCVYASQVNPRKIDRYR